MFLICSVFLMQIRLYVLTNMCCFVSITSLLYLNVECYEIQMVVLFSF